MPFLATQPQLLLRIALWLEFEKADEDGNCVQTVKTVLDAVCHIFAPAYDVKRVTGLGPCARTRPSC